MKSSLRSDEIFSLRLQMKLNPPHPSPREAGFHREAISSTEGGFLPPQADLAEKSRLLSQSAFFLCKDYKKDIFAVFAYDFEPSHNFQVLEKSMFYASFPTIAPGLGGSDFTALLRAFGDREI